MAVSNLSPRNHPGTFLIEPTLGTRGLRTGSIVSFTRLIERDGIHRTQAPFRSITFEGPTPWIEAEKPPFAESFFTHRIAVETEFFGDQGLPDGITNFHRRTDLTFGEHPAYPFILGFRFYYEGDLSVIVKNLGFQSKIIPTRDVALAIFERFFGLGALYGVSRDNTRFLIGHEARWKTPDHLAHVPTEDIQYQDIRGQSGRDKTLAVRVHKGHPKIKGDKDSLEIRMRFVPTSLEGLLYRPLANDQLGSFNLSI